MPNHVHLIVVPQAEDGLKLAIGETHRRYSRRINFRMGWRGHLWQGRFSSSPMDERYLLAAVRYVERNPTVAGLVRSPGEYPWSSARHYLRQQVDPLIQLSPLGDSQEPGDQPLAHFPSPGIGDRLSHGWCLSPSGRRCPGRRATRSPAPGTSGR
jgi:putative transposase